MGKKHSGDDISSRELRRFTRFPLRVEVLVSEDDSSTGTRSGELLFDVVNISEGGAFLRADFSLTPGKQLVLRVLVDGQEQPLELPARIAWVSRGTRRGCEAGMGIEFDKLGTRERELLQGLIRSRLEAYSPVTGAFSR